MALLSSFPASNILGSVAATSSQTATFVTPSSSAAITGTTLTMTATYRSAAVLLNINQVSPSSSHLLDVYVQHSVDAGTTFDDFIHFLQVPGKAASTPQFAQWIRDTAASSSTAGNFSSVRTTATASLAAGTVLQGPIGASWRGFATVTGASSSQPWKLNLSAQVAQ